MGHGGVGSRAAEDVENVTRLRRGFLGKVSRGMFSNEYVMYDKSVKPTSMSV